MSTSSQAQRVADLLKRRHLKVVFAESCTGGLIAGALTQIPGISNHLCGSMVVYRNQTKAAWLKIGADVLNQPGPVSRKVTKLLAEAVLMQTPEADVALAVTGHLGPGAPKRLDGTVYVQILQRPSPAERAPPSAKSFRVRYPAGTARRVRLRQAVTESLKLLADYLEALHESR